MAATASEQALLPPLIYAHAALTDRMTSSPKEKDRDATSVLTSPSHPLPLDTAATARSNAAPLAASAGMAASAAIAALTDGRPLTKLLSHCGIELFDTHILARHFALVMPRLLFYDRNMAAWDECTPTRAWLHQLLRYLAQPVLTCVTPSLLAQLEARCSPLEQWALLPIARLSYIDASQTSATQAQLVRLRHRTCLLGEPAPMELGAAVLAGMGIMPLDNTFADCAILTGVLTYPRPILSHSFDKGVLGEGGWSTWERGLEYLGEGGESRPVRP